MSAYVKQNRELMAAVGNLSRKESARTVVRWRAQHSRDESVPSTDPETGGREISPCPIAQPRLIRRL
jgi:hypothetical protein